MLFFSNSRLLMGKGLKIIHNYEIAQEKDEKVKENRLSTGFP